jgi:hypothetical protein
VAVIAAFIVAKRPEPASGERPAASDPEGPR